MFRALMLHVVSIPVFALQLARNLLAEGWRHLWKRLPLFILILMAYSLLNGLHIVGHLFDEVFFHGYRKTPVKAPVFILGIPRSGTTFLQRLLVRHPELTTFTLWEAVLAPSISERYLYRFLGGLLRPPGKGIRYIRHHLFHHMDKIHKLGLLHPEEDFLLLLPILGCLLPVFACPRSVHYWRLGFFDRDLSMGFRNQLLDFYTCCLQKHLHYHGDKQRLLSKNPSFTSLTGSLLARFPDAGIIACTRPPIEVVPSQLSALRPAMNILGDGKLSIPSQKKMLRILQHYYSTLGNYAQHPRLNILSLAELKSALEQNMYQLLDFLSLSGDPDFIEHIRQLSSAPTFSSPHRYDLEQFALTEAGISTSFHAVWPLRENATGEMP